MKSILILSYFIRLAIRKLLKVNRLEIEKKLIEFL